MKFELKIYRLLSEIKGSIYTLNDSSQDLFDIYDERIGEVLKELNVILSGEKV